MPRGRGEGVGSTYRVCENLITRALLSSRNGVYIDVYEVRIAGSKD